MVNLVKQEVDTRLPVCSFKDSCTAKQNQESSSDCAILLVEVVDETSLINPYYFFKYHIAQIDVNPIQLLTNDRRIL